MVRRRGSWRARRGTGFSGTVDAAALRAAITAPEPGTGAAVRYEGLRVTGVLDLSHCRLEGAVALVDCVFEENVELTRLVVPALDLSGSTLPSLRADGIVLDGELRMSGAWLGGGGDEYQPLLGPEETDGARAPRRIQEGSTAGVVQLADARIGGNLVVERLTVADRGAWSLLAPRLSVGGSVHARGLKASGSLYLRDARVTYAVNLHAAEVGGIDATGLVCSGGFYADWGFRSTGQVLLRAADVGGVVTFHDSVLAPPAGSLLLSRLRVPRLRLDLREPPADGVHLQDARVDVLVDSEKTWPSVGALSLEGFTYQRLENARSVEVRSRIGWLKRDARIGAGSFEQLAKSYEAAGDERAARTVRHARERHLRRQDRLSGRVWGAVQDGLFGYGYAPRRALLWLLSLVAAGSLWFANHPPPSAGGDVRRAWDPVLYSLDLLVPVASLGYRGAWDPVGVDKAVAVFLIVSGWVLATAVIAGARRVVGRG
ncbi:hypothetical protein ACOT81_45235 [Streptomyces sp. WI04-05B]|uniref:hypothetical protein n=1 Tax=Streptomyces TaxID=1883 RepID=UPI00299FD1A2|nr:MULTISPECIES: hypothetical protein [unclassified Streptomyces]MDX2543462.1 hypothetical protein [Streptomyces sp. WI04-05B]MDX2589131.1 hypothetical protein [Streptomyces sp. WI04-05A]